MANVRFCECLNNYILTCVTINKCVFFTVVTLNLNALTLKCETIKILERKNFEKYK